MEGAAGAAGAAPAPQGGVGPYPERVEYTVEEANPQVEATTTYVGWEDYAYKMGPGAKLVLNDGGTKKQLPCPLVLLRGKMVQAGCRRLFTTAGRIEAHVGGKDHPPLPPIFREAFSVDGHPCKCVQQVQPAFPLARIY